jgi:hypothetical protein
MVTLKPISFINEVIQVHFNHPPKYMRTPVPPDGFIWRDKQWVIREVLEEWKDFERRGKSSHNMRPANQLKAAKRGSRGVGRFYYRVLTTEDRIFQLYFDRSEWDEETKSGAWIIHAEYSYVLNKSDSQPSDAD